MQYSQHDLGDDWEFKIVRAATPVFHSAKVLDQLIEEEARAGWIMLEKLDDSRVRFKRPRRARAQDVYLPNSVDPYRTHYGSVPPQHVLTALVLVGLLVALGLGIAAFMLFAAR